jgi:hypothetical protein
VRKLEIQEVCKMCPVDPSPHGGEILHENPDAKFPQPLAHEHEHVDAPDIAHRPALPDHPQQTAVDIEDEDADPVIDSGPGIADGIDSRWEGRRMSPDEVPLPEPVPPHTPDQPPGPPPVPPAEDDRPPPPPVKLPGQPHAPERVATRA